MAISLFGYSQKDNTLKILVTYSNDTIYGDFKRHGQNKDSLFVYDRPFMIDTLIPIHSLRYYISEEIKYVYLYHKTKKDTRKYFKCKVIIDGSTQLLVYTSGNRELLYVFVAGKYYAVSRRHFSNVVWDKLSSCEQFKTQFEHYYTHNHKKLLLMSKHIKYWKYMLEYYNEECL